MTSTCVTSLDLCAIRVARLSDAGVPQAGATNGYAANSPIRLQVTVTTEAGEEFTQRNGCGDLCAVFEEPDKIKGLQLAMDLCQLDAYLLRLTAGVDVIEDAGEAIGFEFPEVGSTPDPVCLEGWTKAWEGSQPATPTFTAPDAAYMHWVFPFTRWVNGDITMEHQLMVVPVSGKGRENANIGATGPFDDWPSVIASRGGITRIGGWFYDATLPEVECDYVPVTPGS